MWPGRSPRIFYFHHPLHVNLTQQKAMIRDSGRTQQMMVRFDFIFMYAALNVLRQHTLC